LTPDAAAALAAADRIASLHIQIMKELLKKGVDLGVMQALLYSMAGVAGRLPSDRLIAMLGMLVEML
jgi:hypothetical protein